MELLSLLVAVKMSSSPIANGVYRFEWKRAWVFNRPAKVEVVDDLASRRV